LERRTDEEAVVHRWGLARLEEGKTKLRRRMKVPKAPTTAAMRPRGERSFTTARTIIADGRGGRSKWSGEMTRSRNVWQLSVCDL
jgi:hypothetical protein